MKRIFKYISIILTVISFFFAPIAQATVLFPGGGGTGTGTPPIYGQVLVGNSGGTYTLTATSSLGITGGGGGTSASSTLLSDNNTFTGANSFSGVFKFPSLSAGTLNLSSLGIVYPTATSSLSVASPLTLTGTAGALVGGTNLTINCPSCITSNAVSSVSNSDGTLTVTPTTGSVVASIALSHANTWTGIQTWTNGFVNNATSTGSAGFNISGGCFAILNVCIGSGSGSGTVNSGTTGQDAYYASNGTAVSATSTIFITTASNVGIATTTPQSLLTLGSANPTILLESTSANPSILFTKGSQNGEINGGSNNLNFFGGTHTVNPDMLINALGNVAIGSTSPSSRLDILSTLNNQTPLLNIASSTNGTGTTSAFFVGPQGNVGINTSAPLATLDVKGLGTGNLQNLLVESDPGGTGSGGINSITFSNNDTTNYKNQFSLRGGAGYTERWAIGNDVQGNASNNMYVYNDATGETALFIDSAGNLQTMSNTGIGFNNSATIGTSGSIDTMMSRGGAGIFDFGNGSQNNTSGTLLDATEGVGTSTPTAGTIGIGNTGANTILLRPTATSTFGSGINILTGCYAISGVCIGGSTGGTNFWSINGANIFNNTGTNVGIGTTTPWATLSVGGGSGSTVPQFVVASSTGSGTTTSFMVSRNGEVGIGTSVPKGDLDVNPGANPGSHSEPILVVTGDTSSSGITNGQDIDLTTGTGATNGGNFNLLTGGTNGDDNTGNINLTTGGQAGAGTISGNIDLTTGTLSGGNAISGNIVLSIGGVASQGTLGSILFSGGNVGIASTSPRDLLTIGAGTASSSIAVAEYAYGKSGNNATSTSATISPVTSNNILWPIGTSATTLTLCNFTAGQHIIVTVVNPNATAGAITWAVCSGEQLYWAGNVVPVQTTTANQWDVWSFTARSNVGSTTPTQIIISGAQSANF